MRENQISDTLVCMNEQISKLHSKVKGSLGEIKIIENLSRQGFPIFTEFGDNSKVDLITLIDNKPVKIQVKCIKSKDGKFDVYGSKSGPNYQFKYTTDQIDVFGVYVYDQDILVFISAAEVLSAKRHISIRFHKAKNNQSGRWFEDYLRIQDALRDYTPDSLTDNADGDDIVQTASLDGGM